MVNIQVGQIVPRTFTVGYIVLSYVVSYVGALTTLELLHRRTADTGLYNWYLLIGSAVAMGAIAIWSMHFVGNRAIVLLDGDLQMQIAYSSGATALSFFVPIFVLLAAFLAIGTNDKVSKVRVVIGGTLAGLAICGMHYLGQAGIANYGCVYSIAHVAGSAVIAVIASITALSIFFVFRAAWTNSAWKRALCAVVLAGAVSGMHWLASVGTQYKFRGDVSLKQNISRDQTVIIVIALSIGACAILLAFAILAKRRRSKSASRAQQVILACATFDPEGRLLVTPEGLLPTEKITNSFEERSFDDIFSIAHPVFLWIFRTTRYWRGIASLIPNMRRHLHTTATLNMMKNGTNTPSPHYASADDSDGVEDYSIIFRELFCVAAAGLAEQLNEPLENLGVLYDQIVITGTISGRGVRGRKSRLLQLKSEAVIHDTERGSPTPLSFGPGKLLFVVRRTNKAEATRLQAAGFRFAAAPQVVDHLSRRMQVGRDEFGMHLDDMREYSGEEHMLEPGVHLACFAIRAGVRGGFDVLVRKDAKNLLPTVQLPIASIEPWHSEFLSQFNGWSVSACLRWLRTKSAVTSEKDKMFMSQFHNFLTALVEDIDEPFFQEALFVAKSVEAPCRGAGHSAIPSHGILLAFRHIVPIHFQPSNPRLVFSPLSLFRCQQQVYKNMADHELFARKTHREIAPVFDSRPSMHHDRQNSTQTMARPGLSRKGSSLLSIFKPNRSPPGIFRGDNSSKNNLVENQTLGGIMVSTEFSVAVGKGDAQVEMHDLGTSGLATKEVEDPEIFVDVLIQACKGK